MGRVFRRQPRGACEMIDSDSLDEAEAEGEGEGAVEGEAQGDGGEKLLKMLAYIRMLEAQKEDLQKQLRDLSTALGPQPRGETPPRSPGEAHQ